MRMQRVVVHYSQTGKNAHGQRRSPTEVFLVLYSFIGHCVHLLINLDCNDGDTIGKKTRKRNDGVRHPPFWFDPPRSRPCPQFVRAKPINRSKGEATEHNRSHKTQHAYAHHEKDQNKYVEESERGDNRIDRRARHDYAPHYDSITSN